MPYLRQRRTIHNNGDVYELDGLYHRANGPSIIWDTGTEWKWHLKGLKHRYYGPASRTTQNKIWVIHGNAIKIDKI